LFYKLRIIEPRAKKNPPMLHCQDWMNTLFWNKASLQLCQARKVLNLGHQN
jgi:hypothetical protein